LKAAIRKLKVVLCACDITKSCEQDGAYALKLYCRGAHAISPTGGERLVEKSLSLVVLTTLDVGVSKATQSFGKSEVICRPHEFRGNLSKSAD
jgi:hypothetical protein